MDIFIELSIIIVIATLVSFLMRLLKQPLVVGYILSGIILGPYFLNVIHSTEEIEVFSKIGISILLFIVGLSLSPTVVKEVGKVSFFSGVGQVVFTSIIGYFICHALGLGVTQSILVSISITFSSTIIILKLLGDKGDLNKLYGRVALGFLLVQDVVATLVLVVVSTLGMKNGDQNIFLTIGKLFVEGTIITLGLYFISRKILVRFAHFLASSQELLFIFSLAWGFGISAIFYTIGFSIEIGALIAGITLAVSPFAYEISSRLKPLRDFFILLFFILLGSGLVLSDASNLVSAGVVLSVFILIGNPLIVFFLMDAMHFKVKTSFQAGLTVAQISEFSLILMSLAYSFGFVTKEILSLVTVVGIITIASSAYLIMYSDKIYEKCAPFLKYISVNKNKKTRKEGDNTSQFDVVLFGFGRIGVDFVQVFEQLKSSFLVVDFNPHTLDDLKKRNIPFLFGDAEDVEFLEELNLKNSSLVVSTIPDFNTNMLLINYAKNQNPHIIFIALSHDSLQADRLYEAGASYVVMPHYLGARHAGNIIKQSAFNHRAYEKHRLRHLLAIKTRHFL